MRRFPCGAIKCPLYRPFIVLKLPGGMHHGTKLIESNLSTAVLTQTGRGLSG